METLWLELLLNLSFSMEGQQMILKISGRKTQVDSVIDLLRLSIMTAKQLLYIQVVMETLWLELLLNLSFSMEGQQMILKISGRKTQVDSAADLLKLSIMTT